jgi:hypothetical protein
LQAREKSPENSHHETDYEKANSKGSDQELSEEAITHNVLAPHFPQAHVEF